MKKYTARDCLIRTLNMEKTDRIPCCFMSFAVLRKQVKENLFALSREELKMGLDSMLIIPSASRAERPTHPDLRGLPVQFHPDVITKHRVSEHQGEKILSKEYTTPDGTLTTAIKKSHDWPYGNQIPFIDDYQIPRTLKPLITCSDDLKILKKYFLQPPGPQEIKNFKEEYTRAKSFVDEYNVLLVGGWGVGLDMAFWLCGMKDLMVKILEQPGFVKDLLHTIHEWNKTRMAVVLSEGIDLYIRRAWYEGCDFVTPEFYEEAILPFLKTETELAHKYGAKFGYICTSGHIPLLDAYIKSGIDVLIGIDPIQGSHTDMEILKNRIGHKICLWGGVSAAITVERGNEEEIRHAVQKALKTLGPSGFILSPIDNITIDKPLTWANIRIFIDEWQKWD